MSDGGAEASHVDAVTRRRVAVADSRGYTTDEVAVHAVTMMLNLVRRLPFIAATMRAGGWLAPDDLVGMPRLSELQLGLVGLGNVGSRVAEISSTLGVHVTAHDPCSAHSRVDMVDSLHDLLEAAHIVSLHVPLTQETRYLSGSASSE
jgi:D-3-phosphoglycerate dehydrogenase